MVINVFGLPPIELSMEMTFVVTYLSVILISIAASLLIYWMSNKHFGRSCRRGKYSQ